MEEIKGREGQIIEERKKKLAELKKDGINPYSHRFDLHEQRVHSTDVLAKYEKLKNEEESKDKVIVAGRIMSQRSFGKLSFAKLQDVKGFIQLVFQDGKTSDESIAIFKKIDSGDIVGIVGHPLRTRTGEMSILVDEITLLTKSVLPLPEKFHGLKDDEEKLRKRYLDIIMNPEVKDIFIKKQKFVE